MTAAGIGSFQASTDSVEFGTVTLGQTADSSVTLLNQGSTAISVSALNATGNDFIVTSPSTLPVSVAPNSTISVVVQFKPKASGDSSGQLTISSSSSTNPSLKIKLHGDGGSSSGSSSPTLGALSCSQSSMTGSGRDACTVTLSAAAGSSGLVVSLSSSNKAVTVPASVTVAAGATSAGFTATVSSVTTAQNALLTASAGRTAQTYSLALGAYVPGLKLSTTSLNFGSVTVNTSSSQQSVMLTSSGTAPITINSATLSGAGFSLTGMSFPTTLNPGKTAAFAVVFDPSATGTASASITVSDNASPSTATISLSGTGQTTGGVLSGLSCATNSFTGSGSAACTVTLNAAAGSSGLVASLSSSNRAVTVPASVTVAAGATSVGFTATVSTVPAAQTATLTASAGGTTKTYAISLGAAIAALTPDATRVTFGNVDLNTPATQSVTLTSTGAAPLTISAGSASGSEFSISGLTFPANLNPGQTATLYIQFDPTSAGTATGAVTLTSNASPSTTTISLSGTGATVSYQVNLTWNAPVNSVDSVTGYNVYRATGNGSSYQLINVSPDASRTYTDSTVLNGTSYTYFVKSVDAEGNQSAPSNTFSVSIP